MVYCSQCGKKNKDDAEFCSKCGTPLTVHPDSATLEERVDDFAEEMGKLGKKVGKKVETAAKEFSKEADDIGKRVEKKMDRMGKGLESWYDRSFGIFGPLVSSFLGLIILRFIIGVMDFASDDAPFLGDLSEFLYTYLLWFFGLMLLSSYSSYLYRKYKKQFRWVSPVSSAIGITVVLWIVSQFLVFLEGYVDVPYLGTTASFIESYLVIIFVFVLLIGYLILMFSVSMEKALKR